MECLQMLHILGYKMHLGSKESVSDTSQCVHSVIKGKSQTNKKKTEMCLEDTSHLKIDQRAYQEKCYISNCVGCS